MPSRSPIALVAALLLPLALAWVGLPTPAVAGDFIDAAGRHLSLPEVIGRVMPAERNAEVLVYVLAPQKLAGLERGARRAAPLPGESLLPVLDWGPRTNPAQMALAARELAPDLVVDAGAVTPQRAAFADEVQRLTGIPYILIDDSFSRMPLTLRSLGAVLGVAARANDLALYADHAISGLRGRLLITPPDARPHVYYALGYDGLTTALPGSPAGAAIDEAGAINVATPMGGGIEVRISPAQLHAWDPPVVIAENRGVFDALRRDPEWRDLSAVRGRHVYLEPTYPFGWIEDPSGVNRLVGLHWLSTLFYPTATQEDLRSAVCEFYDKFYRIKLTNARVETLVRPAGATPADAQRSLPEPLTGLGAAPPSSLPAGSPGALATAPVPRSKPSRAGGAAAPDESANPSALTGVPGLPNTAPNAPCTIPTAPTPEPLQGLAPVPGVSPMTPAAPGVPTPGRRGRPTTSLERPIALDER